jgi:hypothetical protein
VADVVDQFRRLVRLLLKWALIAAAVVAGLTGEVAASIHGYEWWTYDRHLALVNISTSLDDPRCNTPEFPVLVRIENRSTKTIAQTRFELAAKRPNRSSDVTKQYNTKDNDYIIPPGKTLTGCEIDELVDDERGEDPRKLEWSAYLVSVEFED